MVTGHQRYPTVAHIIEWLHNRNPFIIKILQQFYDKNYESDDENFNCLIIGKGGKNTYLFRANKYPGLPLGFLFLNGYITFGYYNEWENEYYPGKGWVYTQGSNGVKEWEGWLYGQTGKKILIPYPMYDNWGFVTAYKFTGINFLGLVFDFFIGRASHVALGPEPPPLD